MKNSHWFSQSLRSLLSPLLMGKSLASSSVPQDHACLTVKQCNFGLLALSTKPNCIHFLGRAWPGGGEAISWWSVCHPCARARSHWSSFQKGASVWRWCLGLSGQQRMDGNWKRSGLSQKCFLPTLHACSTCVKLPMLVIHTHSSSAPEALGQPSLHFCSWFTCDLHPWFLMVVLALTTRIHPSYTPCKPEFISLWAVSPGGCCKGQGAPHRYRNCEGLDHIKRYCSFITNWEQRQPFPATAESLHFPQPLNKCLAQHSLSSLCPFNPGRRNYFT